MLSQKFPQARWFIYEPVDFHIQQDAATQVFGKPVAPSYRLRPYEPGDLGFLWKMLYEAAHWRPGEPRPPKEEALSEPKLARYLQDWGRPDDTAVLAIDLDGDGRLGAAWYRFMTYEEPGYGSSTTRRPRFPWPSSRTIAVAAWAERC